MKTELIKSLKENLDQLLDGTVRQFIASAKFNEQERAAYNESLRNIVARLNNPKLTIAVVGRQRSGKSTFLNALVNDGANVSPVDEITCTNGLSLVSYSTMNDTAYVHMVNDIKFDPIFLSSGNLGKSIKEAFTNRVRSVLKHITGASSERKPGEKIDNSCRVQTISRDELELYVTHTNNADNYKGVVLTEVVSPSPVLKPGIVLIDSPGIDANQDDTALAHMVAEEVDVTIMVYSKLGNLGNLEMAFLVQSLAVGEQRIKAGQPLRRKVFLVQNDWARDEYTSPAEHLAQCSKVEQKTRESIQKEWKRRQKTSPNFPQGEPPFHEIIRVNCKLAGIANEKRLPDKLVESGLPKLQQAILDYHASGRLRQLIHNALVELTELLERIEDGLKLRSNILNKHGEEIKNQTAQLQMFIAELDASDSELSKRQLQAALFSVEQQENNRVIATLKIELERAKREIHDTAGRSLSDGCNEAANLLKKAFDDGLLQLDKGKSLIIAQYEEVRENLKSYRKKALTVQFEEMDGGSRGKAKKYQHEVRGVEVDVSFDFLRWLRKIFSWLGLDQQKGVDSLMSDVDTAIADIIKQTAEKIGPVIREELEEKNKVIQELWTSIRGEVEGILEQLNTQSMLSDEEKGGAEINISKQRETLKELNEYTRHFLGAVGDAA